MVLALRKFRDYKRRIWRRGWFWIEKLVGAYEGDDKFNNNIIQKGVPPHPF